MSEKLTEPQRRCLALMASRPNGWIDMYRGRMEAATSTMSALENKGFALWCEPYTAGEPQGGRITDAGRKALEAQ